MHEITANAGKTLWAHDAGAASVPMQATHARPRPSPDLIVRSGRLSRRHLLPILQFNAYSEAAS